jgi:predicted GTPase
MMCFEREIRKQVHIAIEEANAIIFMVDAATGITNLDENMADMLRRSTKPVFLVVNKVDNHARMMEASEFYSLGFERIFFISSISGSGRRITGRHHRPDVDEPLKTKKKIKYQNLPSSVSQTPGSLPVKCFDRQGAYHCK